MSLRVAAAVSTPYPATQQVVSADWLVVYLPWFIDLMI